MSKRPLTRRSWLRASAAAPLALAGCGAAKSSSSTPKTAASAAGAAKAPSKAGPRASMLWIREEEKLARDVYLTLGERWPGIHQFQNIARSEQRHMDAMAGLLRRAGLDDPIPDEADIGRFAADELGALYRELVATGEASELAALEVGARIEELDIADLERAIAEQDDPDAKAVYGRLRCASHNHLRAFVRGIEARGERYRAQVLEPEAVAAILAGEHQRCGAGPGHGRGRGRGPGHHRGGRGPRA